MRVLLYGMQSSGASLVAFWLAQAADTVGVVDVHNGELVPPLDAPGAAHVVAKCVVTTRYAFDDHARSFHPDRTILVLRDPAQNYMALARKEYAEQGGPVDEKFARLEACYHERARFDLVLRYEDFVRETDETVAALRGIGVSADEAYYGFPRGQEEILALNSRLSPWCADHYRRGWGFGNVQGRDVRSAPLFKYTTRRVRRRVRDLCPELSASFDAYYADRIPAGTRYLLAAWHDLAVRGTRAALVRSAAQAAASRRWIGALLFGDGNGFRG